MQYIQVIIDLVHDFAHDFFPYYPMDNCFTGWRYWSRQTSEKDILYIIPAGPVTECAFARWPIVLHFLFTPFDVIASFSCLILLRPLVS